MLVVEKRGIASGGSAAAAGLVNPILGLRARPVWRIEEAVEALDETVALAGAEAAYARRPTLRPARDEEQIDHFRQTAHTYPEHCTWLDDPGPAWLRAPHGALRIETGGAVDIDGLVRGLIGGIDVRQGELVGWDETTAGITARLAAPRGAKSGRDAVTARHLILALGRSYTAFPALMRLRLHQVKGQTIRMTRPSPLPIDAPHLAGTGYVAMEAGSKADRQPGGTIVCGATYEHRFADLAPSPRATEAILQKIEHMLPSIRGAELIDERAGVRVTVPGIRLPMVGPLPGHQNVWIFTGLGAKGLLTGPLIARELPSYLKDPEQIPTDVRVRPNAR